MQGCGPQCRLVSEPRAVATGSSDTLENVRCATQLRLDPVATARGSDTIAENTGATNFPTDSFSRVIGISREAAWRSSSGQSQVLMRLR